MNLEKLLKPKSIAIIGASESEGFGGDTTRNLFSFTKDLDRVYLVNPKRDTIFGKKCYHSVSEIDDNIDLAVFCTPQRTIVLLLDEVAKKGCKGAVVFASGYGETGPEGKLLEDELVEKCEEHDIALMGPNCAGFANYIDNLFLFAFKTEERERKGNIGMIAQSGQVCLSAMDYPGFKFSYVISSGNSPSIKVEDYLEFLVDDPDTKVVTAYVEGIKDPEVLVRAFEKAAKIKKPIIILKTGRSPKSQELAESHTGSLSGSDAAFRAILDRYGVIEADDLQELYSLAMLFSGLEELPKDDRYVFMNGSGGEATIVADLAYMYDIRLAEMTEESNEALQAMLPSYATVNNPLDMTATIGYDTDRMAIAFRTLFKDPNVDCISIAYTITPELFDLTVQHMTDAIEIVSNDEDRKPIFWLPFVEHTRHSKTLETLTRVGTPVLPSGKYGAQVLNRFNKFIKFQYESMGSSLPEDSEGKSTVACSEYDSMKFLEENGMEISPQAVASSREDAIKVANELGFPVVLKISSQDILHKSDIGGVKLNLKNDDQVGQAFDTIIKNAKEQCPDSRFDGVLIKPMLEAGVEFIVGINNDDQFGPMLMVGLGGVFVEIFKDIQLSPVPVNKDQAHEMIKKLKGYKLLDGYRGGAKSDIEALINYIVKISEIAAKQKNVIKELDINPLFVTENGVEMADALLIRYED